MSKGRRGRFQRKSFLKFQREDYAFISGITVYVGEKYERPPMWTQLFAEGKYAEALTRFQAAVESNPNDADSYYNIAAIST